MVYNGAVVVSETRHELHLNVLESDKARQSHKNVQAEPNQTSALRRTQMLSQRLQVLPGPVSLMKQPLPYPDRYGRSGGDNLYQQQQHDTVRQNTCGHASDADIGVAHSILLCVSGLRAKAAVERLTERAALTRPE